MLLGVGVGIATLQVIGMRGLRSRQRRRIVGGAPCGPAQAIALTLSASTARNIRDLVMIGHLRDARIAGPVPAAPLGGTSVAAPSRRTMTIREPQWPRDFLDRRLRTMKGIAKRRRSIPMTIGLRRRTAPRPRNVVVTPVA